MISYNGRAVIGFGEGPRPSECACKKILGVGEVTPPASAPAHSSPWAVAIGTSVLGAVAGWVVEATRGKRR